MEDMEHSASRRRSRGFTLTEMLAGIAMLAILAGLLIPISAAMYRRFRLTEMDDFARQIFDLAGKEIELEPISTAAYPTAARRPLNSRLDCSALAAAGLTPLPEWQDALARYLQALEEEKV